MGNITENFSRSEFACKCGCGADNINPVLVEDLQVMRDALGRPITITSGVRCAAHNLASGGKETSEHLNFNAADLFAPNSRVRFGLIRAATLAGFHRIGIAETFIHLDISTAKNPKVLWLY